MVAATQMAVAVEEVLLDIAALAEMAVAISMVVGLLGPVGLEVEVVAEEEEPRLTRKSFVTAVAVAV